MNRFEADEPLRGDRVMEISLFQKWCHSEITSYGDQREARVPFIDLPVVEYDIAGRFSFTIRSIESSCDENINITGPLKST